MEALILAGGRGTRLASVVSDRPKPMALVGDKPFLHHLINYLLSFNVNKIVLSVGYMHQKIMDYFGNAYLGCKIDYAVENEPLGTGGAIINSLPLINGKEFILLNGDTYFPINLQKFCDFAQKHKAEILMALKQLENTDRYGRVVLDGGERVVSFHEKQPGSAGYINGGIYYLRKEIFQSYASGLNLSFENMLSELIKKYNVYGMIDASFFIDIGIPEDYLTLQVLNKGKLM